MKNKVQGLAALLITVLIWGFAYPLLDIVIDNGVGIELVVSLRLLLAVLTLLPFSIKNFKNISKHEIILSLIAGAALFVGFELGTLGIQTTTAASNALLVSAGIFIVPILSWIFLKKRPSFKLWIAIFLSFVGIIIINYNGSFQFSFNIGTLFSFFGGVMFGVHIFILATYLKEDNVMTVSFFQMAFAAILMILTFMIFSSQSIDYTLLVDNIWPVLYLGVLGSGVAFLLQTFASKFLTANTCNIILNLESVFAVIFSILLGRDVFSVNILLGALLVFGGVTLISFDKKNL